MAYTKTNWEDAPSTATPLCAESLNKIENGIYENSIDIALADGNINTLSERIIAINTALSAKADKTELEDEITDIDETVTMKINLKADKATTLAGYGIDDAYTKTYVSKALSYKLDKKPFDTEPVKNSPNYITSGTLYNCVNTLNQNIAAKYDSSNFESGTGTLAPAQEIYAGCEGSFVYSKNGNIVTVSVNITALLSHKKYIQMSGLPYAAKNESRLSSFVVYSTANKLINIRLDGSWIYASSTDIFAEDEKINFIITYIIR
jgi:hypothetical protein